MAPGWVKNKKGAWGTLITLRMVSDKKRQFVFFTDPPLLELVMDLSGLPR